jgi:hypothetical protein
VTPRALPILVMAGESGAEAGRFGLAAADVVTQPLDPGALRDAIARHLGDAVEAGEAGRA